MVAQTRLNQSSFEARIASLWRSNAHSSLRQTRHKPKEGREKNESLRRRIEKTDQRPEERRANKNRQGNTKQTLAVQNTKSIKKT